MRDMSTSLARAVVGAGYYPALANHVLKNAIGEEEVRGHFVHAETTFDTSEVRRHMTVLVLTDARLIRVHIDDGAGPESGGAPAASATVESAPLRVVTSVALTHVVLEPESFREGDVPGELVLAIGWGIHSRLDLEPATCGDESCDADHGYTGDITGDDTLARVSVIADGADTVRALEEFTKALQRRAGH